MRTPTLNTGVHPRSTLARRGMSLGFAVMLAIGAQLPPINGVLAPATVGLVAPIQSAAAVGTPCSNFSDSYPKFHGFMSTSGGTQLTSTTTGTVYGRVSNVDQSWDLTHCYAYRYDAFVWATTNATTNLTVDWGALSGDGNACRYIVGTADYLHANSGACPGSPSSARLVVSLSPQATYQEDAALNTKGDFAFAHADCYSFYGAEKSVTGASTSSTSGRPGTNCGNKAIEATDVNQAVVYDSTSATVSSFNAPASPTSATTLAYSLTFSESVTGLAASDFTVGGTATGWTVGAPTGSGAGPYTINLTGGGAGTVVLTLNASAVTDAAGNGSPTSSSSAPTVTVDRSPATVSSFNAPASPTSATTLAYSLTFSESVTGLAASDFTVGGTATGWTVGAPTGSGAGPYTINLTGGGAGTVVLTLNASAVTDAAGNGSPTSSSSAPTVTVDRSPATVSSFNAPASPTSATTLAYSLTFSESVTGLAASDFTVGGTATGWTVGAPTGSGAGPYTINLTGGGAGTVVLTLNASAVTDAAGNGSPTSSSSAPTVTVDRSPATVSSFNAPASPTSATTLAYSLTFSESVTGLAASDFTVGGTATGWTVGAPTGSGAGPYTINLTGGGAGTVVLTLNASAVTDAAGNGSPTSSSSAPTVTVDRSPATVSSFNAPASPTSATTLAYSLTFSESVTGLAASDFTVGGTATGWTVGAPTGSGAGPYTINLTGGGAGTVVLTLNASAVTDAAGNGSPTSSSSAPTVTVDRSPATVSSFNAPASPTSATTLAYSLTFSESVTGLAASDFTVGGTATGWTVGAPTGSGAGPYTINLTGGGAGTVVLTLNASAVTDAAGNGSPTSSSSAPTVTVDRSPATVSSFNAPASPTSATTLAYSLTFSESVTGLAASDFTSVARRPAGRSARRPAPGPAPTRSTSPAAGRAPSCSPSTRAPSPTLPATEARRAPQRADSDGRLRANRFIHGARCRNDVAVWSTILLRHLDRSRNRRHSIATATEGNLAGTGLLRWRPVDCRRCRDEQPISRLRDWAGERLLLPMARNSE